MIAVYEYVFGWMDARTQTLFLGFITFAFVIALVKFIKR